MNGTAPDRNERRKPRLVPVLALFATIAAGLGATAAFVLLKVQYDILQLANHASQTLLPDIQDQVRTALNLERLKVFGEVVRSSPEPRERREALLALRILAMNTIYEKDVFTSDQINRVYRLAERMAAYRTRQDAALQSIHDHLAEFHANIDETSATPSAGHLLPGTDSLHDLLPNLYRLLHATLSNPRSPAARQAFKTLEQELARWPVLDTNPGLDRIRPLLQWQQVIFNTEDELNSTWMAARAIIDHLSQNTSIAAAVSASEGSAEIADHAKSAMILVAVAMSGLILLFAAGVYFMRWTVVKPIIRVTRNLEQVRATQQPVPRRRE